ncbi:MAG: prephenate dehydrogenase [Candidatus Nanopelagicales bacterium]
MIGSGLIGASIGLALSERGAQVWLDDLDEASLQTAVGRGAGLAGRPEHDPDLVIVAVPPAAAAQVVIASLRTYLDATVSDVASTKAELVREVEASGADLSRFVPGHPLAGREVSGPGAARADLFSDRVWALTPTPRTDPQRVELVSSLVAGLGAVPVVTSAEAHDRAVALTSHTPQVVASLVAAGLEPLGEAEVRLSGQGLRDVTRLAASDPALWTEILASNAAPVAEALDALIARLGQVRDGLRHGDADPVRAALAEGVAGHLKVPGKHGSAPTTYAVVPVVVADRPGELGRLFADAGATGVNLEDVRIEHAQGRPTGRVELEVRPEAAARLAEGLRGHGWDVRD